MVFSEIYKIDTALSNDQVWLHGAGMVPSLFFFIGSYDMMRIANIGSEDLIFLAICTPRFSDDVHLEPVTLYLKQCISLCFVVY
jgi:hypothetical protein